VIPLASKYQVFCQAVSHKSFTEAAKVLHYSQSAVSQAVKAVEQEVGLTLVLRKKDGIELTSDGKKVYPYIQNICDAEMALAHKTFEMEQLQSGIVRIGTFPTVSREALPTLIKQFKAEHPSVRFVLYQGEYTSIASMLQSGKVEIGFSHLGFCEEFEAVPLFRDPLAAVLPPEPSLAKQSEITLEQSAHYSRRGKTQRHQGRLCKRLALAVARIQSVRLRYDHGGGRAGTGRLAFIPVVSERLHRSRGRPSHQGAA